MPTKKYRIEFTEQQLKVLRLALTSYYRLGIGHLEGVLGDLAISHFNSFGNDYYNLVQNDPRLKSAIKDIRSIFFRLKNTSCSKSITTIDDMFQIAYEMSHELKEHRKKEECVSTAPLSTGLKLTTEPKIQIEAVEVE